MIIWNIQNGGQFGSRNGNFTDSCFGDKTNIYNLLWLPLVCSTGEFQCDDGGCIDERFKCDTFPDCTDESDESTKTCKFIKCWNQWNLVLSYN